MYLLESALDDVERDLAGDPGDADYRGAFRHLYQAAVELRDGCVEPRAELRPEDVGV
jgi:hypothetical protein